MIWTTFWDWLKPLIPLAAREVWLCVSPGEDLVAERRLNPVANCDRSSESFQLQEVTETKNGITQQGLSQCHGIFRDLYEFLFLLGIFETYTFTKFSMSRTF